MQDNRNFFTDETTIFKFEGFERVALLKNLETGEITRTPWPDDGIIEGFRKVDLNPPPLLLSQESVGARRGRKNTPPLEIQKPGPRSKKSSPYFGVSFHKRTGKYRAVVRINKQYKWLGEYTDPVKAAMAVDAELVRIGLPPKNHAVITARMQEDKVPSLAAQAAEGKEDIAESDMIFSCHGCGADYDEKPTTCVKCGGTSFEKSVKR